MKEFGVDIDIYLTLSKALIEKYGNYKVSQELHNKIIKNLAEICCDIEKNKANLEDRMIGCTTLEIPEKYNMVLKESCHLQEENNNLKDELELLNRKYKVALHALVQINDFGNLDNTAQSALIEINKINNKEE